MLLLLNGPFCAATELFSAIGESKMTGKANVKEQYNGQNLEKLPVHDNPQPPATRLKISVHTVHDHTLAIYKALSVSTRGEFFQARKAA